MTNHPPAATTAQMEQIKVWCSVDKSGRPRLNAMDTDRTIAQFMAGFADVKPFRIVPIECLKCDDTGVRGKQRRTQKLCGCAAASTLLRRLQWLDKHAEALS